MENTDHDYRNHNIQQPGTSGHNTEAVTAEDIEEVPVSINVQNRNIESVWTFHEKVKLVKIDIEEREHGRGFMVRVRDRWRQESSTKVETTTQNLRDNANRFKKEGTVMAEIERWERSRNDGRNENSEERHEPTENTENPLTWTTEMKVRLVEIDMEERQNGKGFMRRVKNRWNAEFNEYRNANEQKLRDNAARFKQEKEIANLVLVRKRQESEIDIRRIQSEEEEVAADNGGVEIEPMVEDNAQDETESGNTEEVITILESDIELERLFRMELQQLVPTTMETIETREKLPKLRLTSAIEKSANNILSVELKEANDIMKITDTVYAMGKAVAKMTGVKKKEAGRVVPGGNRSERKLRHQIKQLRQLIARTANELHRRKMRRKPTKRERRLLKEIGTRIEGGRIRSDNLRAAKEGWLDELRNKKVKLDKMSTRAKRIKNNAMFAADEGGFYRKGKGTKIFHGEVPPMEKFVEFWGGIWEDEKKTPEQPWMKVVEQKLKEKVQDVKEFVVTREDLAKVVKRRKNWSAPGIDGIQNFWWKRFKEAWDALRRAMVRWKQEVDRIPRWLTFGRSVLSPKTEDLSPAGDYRPITCLNTSYKIYTGMMGRYMKEHAESNNIWDEGQLGAMEGVLGTVDQLLIDKCITDEVREHRRNLAVAFYDYTKAYDKVHHDWMLRVYRWMRIPEDVIKVIERLMQNWKTKLEVNIDGRKMTSRWIQISCGFLQGDSYSPVGFCLSEVPIGMLLSETRGYRMGPPGHRTVKRTHSLFVDDLKMYQESHELLSAVNEMIVKASDDTGACYGVKKCAEIVFDHGKMVKGDGMEVLQERMKTLDPEKNEHYKFLGIEQAEKNKKEKVLERVVLEMEKRVKMLTELELYDRNMIRAINCRVIPVAGYPMNVCKFSKADLRELDMTLKKELRLKNMLGRQSSDERLYMKRQVGGRGLKSLREVYQETKVRIATYMSMSESRWIAVVWKREYDDEYCSVKREAEQTLAECGLEVTFNEKGVTMNGESMIGPWKTGWRKLKEGLKKGMENNKKSEYMKKEMQSKVYKDQELECSEWLKCNLDPKKTAAIVNMQEQMIETRKWKGMRGLNVESVLCRLCGQYDETVQHLLAGCTVLAGTEYVRRHNSALMVLAVQWGKQHGIIEEGTLWYQQRWVKGHVVENDKFKMVWDFEYKLRKYNKSRRPDLTLEDRDGKHIWLVDMACPQEQNIEAKHREKLNKYQQLAFETREKRLGFHVEIIPLVIGCLGGGIKKLQQQIKKLIPHEKDARWVVRTMQKTVLMESETLLRKVLSKVVQED